LLIVVKLAFGSILAPAYGAPEHREAASAPLPA